MIDSHVHLNREEFAGDREAVLARAAAAGVTGFLNVGYDPASSRASVALAAADVDKTGDTYVLLTCDREENAIEHHAVGVAAGADPMYSDVEREHRNADKQESANGNT